MRQSSRLCFQGHFSIGGKGSNDQAPVLIRGHSTLVGLRSDDRLFNIPSIQVPGEIRPGYHLLLDPVSGFLLSHLQVI